MLILSFFSFVGFLISFICYLCLISNISIPSRKVATVLNIGLVLFLCLRIIIIYYLDKKRGRNFYRKLKKYYPRWVKVIMYPLMTYGLISGIIYLSLFVIKLSPKMSEADYIIATKRLFTGYFLVVIWCYAFIFLFHYSYNIFKKEEYKKLESELTLN